MIMFDFTYNSETGQLEKVGYYSRCVPREATREEVLLWQRVQELERTLERARPTEVLRLLTNIPPEASRIKVHPNDFARLRQYAPDLVSMVTVPSLNRERILGEMSRVKDGLISTVWVEVDRGVPEGEVVEGLPLKATP